jgi:3-oxo-5-alpha-steroid 4-dehydrogenase 1
LNAWRIFSCAVISFIEDPHRLSGNIRKRIKNLIHSSGELMLLPLILAVFLHMNLFYLIALLRRNFAVVDIGWGLGFVLVGIISYLHSPLHIKNGLVLGMVCCWGLRLGYYLFRRNHNKPEDFRYAEMRRGWEPHPNLQAYFKVFMLQGALMLVISLPVSYGMLLGEKELRFYHWVGLFLWALGFGLELASDRHLERFKARPENHGKICTDGPWRLCRYPNYFGETLLWYGLYLFILAPGNWWTILGPLTINFFLLKVSGVPLLEDKYRKREDYRDYARQVPRFVPFTRPRPLS